MNNCYRYGLEKYKTPASRHTCPSCGQKKTFTRYVDNETGEYINENVGICNRVNKCAYHYTPKQYFEDNNISNVTDGLYLPKKQQQKELISFVKTDLMQATLKNYEQNNFFLFIQHRFGTDIALNVCNLYRVGTSKHYENSTIFWQVDVFNNIRTGKIMQYNPQTGKRVKEKTNWVHSVLHFENFNLKQCLFGEHLLLQDLNKTVAVVESEKTAIIGHIYYPKFIWLATGGWANLNEEKCRHISKRNVIFFPDTNMLQKWQSRLNEFKNLSNYSVSKALENNLTDEEKTAGYDIADFLLKYDLAEF